MKKPPKKEHKLSYNPKVEKRVPFQRLVEAHREGVPVDMYSLGPEARKRLKKSLGASSLRTRILVILMTVVVFAIMFYLERGQHKAAPAADGALSLGAPVATPVEVSPTPRPADLARVRVAGGQFLDASDERPLPKRPKGTLWKGDYISVTPRAVGRPYLYFIVYEPNQQFRLTRYYPPEVWDTTAPPLKIKLKGEVPGKYQVLLLGTKDEVPKIQYILQRVNLWEGRQKANIREARANFLMAELTKELPSGRWAYKVLPEVQYAMDPPAGTVAGPAGSALPGAVAPGSSPGSKERLPAGAGVPAAGAQP